MSRRWSFSLLWIGPMIIASTIVCGTVSEIVSRFNKSVQGQLGVARRWAKSLLWIAGVSVEVEGAENLQGISRCVFAANHLSYMDTPVMLGHVPIQFMFMAKSGLFKIPFMGWHLTRAGHIPVPIDDPRAGLRTLAHAAELIDELGVALLIFPEGGRSESGELQEFKDGAAYVALKSHVPLVPMALIGTREILQMHTLRFQRGRVKLCIGKPIHTAGMSIKQRGEVTSAARDQVVEMLQTRQAVAAK
ncbi:MAG: lysophospholipid acyltransferase family protein [Acidobacteriota bacterium]